MRVAGIRAASAPGIHELLELPSGHASMPRLLFLTERLLFLLTIALVMTTNAVVKVENYRYPNVVGLCTQFNITSLPSGSTGRSALRTPRHELIGFGMCCTD